MILNIDDILADASVGGYNADVAISNTTALTLLSVLSALYDYRRYWTNDADELDEQDEDIIDELLSLANYELMTPIEVVNMQIGSTILWWNDTPPIDYLLCDGAQYLKSTYPDLYAVLGSDFEVDANNFVVPDMRDRVAVGASATRNINDSGGATEQTISKDQLPSHEHHLSAGNVSVFQLATSSYPSGTLLSRQTWTVNATAGYTYEETRGGDIFPFSTNDPLNVEQPFRVANWIIYAG